MPATAANGTAQKSKKHAFRISPGFVFISREHPLYAANTQLNGGLLLHKLASTLADVGAVQQSLSSPKKSLAGLQSFPKRPTEAAPVRVKAHVPNPRLGHKPVGGAPANAAPSRHVVGVGTCVSGTCSHCNHRAHTYYGMHCLLN